MDTPIYLFQVLNNNFTVSNRKNDLKLQEKYREPQAFQKWKLSMFSQNWNKGLLSQKGQDPDTCFWWCPIPRKQK